MSFKFQVPGSGFRGALRVPPFGNSGAESQRDSGQQPRVARHELPWETTSQANNPIGVAARTWPRDATPSGLKIHRAATQGSSFLATLGWKTQSLWDCSSGNLSIVPFASRVARNLQKALRFGVLLLCSSAALAADFTTRVADRAAIERVYYQHRLGTKPPFEEALSRSTLESLVRLDSSKEATLQSAYGMAITPAQLAAEVQRINTTTRAPEMLAEIKAALGHDSGKFASAFAKPILVERELRQRFDNDDKLHAATRRESETARHQLLAAKTNGASPAQLLALLQQSRSNAVTEATWQLGPRPEEKPGTPTADEIEIKKRFGPDAQILSSPHAGADKERKFYFADLPGELQRVLDVQLRREGDVSAVIETPGGFLLYLAKEKTAGTLSAAVLSLPKRGYEQWLAEQTKGEP